MFGLEEDLYAQLLRLRDQFEISYIKAEFEAEGSSFNDLVRLRRLTALAGLGLILKVGGCEPVRDLRDSLELGVDGLVAPMIESPFALAKFWESVNRVYPFGRKPRLAFNVETRTCLDAFDEILDYAEGKMDSFTIGRTDLAGSYMETSVTPDSDFLLNQAEKVATKARSLGWDVWMGGSLSRSSVDLLSTRTALRGTISHFETRKVVVAAPILWSHPEVIAEALRFEELFLMSRQEIQENSVREDERRLAALRHRS
jgi:hypothetical protein